MDDSATELLCFLAWPLQIQQWVLLLCNCLVDALPYPRMFVGWSRKGAACCDVDVRSLIRLGRKSETTTGLGERVIHALFLGMVLLLL